MTTPTFNKFKSTTIYGNFNNVDYPDNTVLASAYFQRNLTVSGDLTCNDATFTGNVNGITASTTDNTTKFATTAFVKSQNYITNGGTVNFNMLNINQSSSTSSAILQFLDNTVTTRALIYPSATANVLRFEICGQTIGYEWNLISTKLMELDASGNLKITGNITAQNYSSTPDLTPYALKSGTQFTGDVLGLTATTSDNTTKFATTAFVKAQNYITSSSLSPYALSSTLSNYALSSTLSNYALLTGATFTGTVNCNNGLTTPAGQDVHISCNNTFPTTNSGGKQGLGFFWNQTGGRGEVDLLTYGQGGTGGLSIWNSNVTNAPSKIVEFYPDGSTFQTPVTMTSQLIFTSVSTTSTPYLNTNSGNNLILSTATNNGLQFSTPSGACSLTCNGNALKCSGNLSATSASIGYSSTADTVVLQVGNGTTDFANLSVNGSTLNISQNVSTGNLKCSGLLDSTNSSGTIGQIPHANGSGGWGWSTAANTTSISATAIATTTITFPAGVFRSSSSVGNPFKINATTINRMTTVYVFANGGVTDNTSINLSNITFTPNGGGATSGSICPVQALNTIPAPINNNIVFNVNFYSNATGAPVLIKAYGALIASPLSPMSYNICIVANQNIPLGTTYSFDPFSFTYCS